MKFSRNPVSKQLAVLEKEAEERDAMRRAEKEKSLYFSRDIVPDTDGLASITKEEVRAARAIVAKGDKGSGKKLTLVAESSKSPAVLNVLEKLKERGVGAGVSVAPWSRISDAWERYEKKSAGVPGARAEIVSEVALEKDALDEAKKSIKEVDDAKGILADVTEDTPTSDVVSRILSAALALGSSDVHIEHKSKEQALIRFRIDGVLKDVTLFSHETARLVVNRLKLLARLKLNIRDAPQDGRFTIASGWGDIEVRVSVVPAEFGEAIVLRVLDPQDIGLELSALGLRADDEEIILQELKRPNGMILITGPTGSGKTTTLYAFLKTVQDPALKIITIEDPIEYHLEGIEQTQTEPEAGYAFASGLRSILRQDPDIVLVGEIRDLETAEVAIHAALTGHLVFSTLHTNNAAGAIPRLIDIGIKTSVLGSALTLVIAQRLVRRLCLECRTKIGTDENMRSDIEKFLKKLPKRVSRPGMDEVGLYRATGCHACADGFRGRIAVAELLRVGDDMETLIRKKATEGDIQKVAREKQGMVLMQEDGILKALQGTTTLDEVERATGPILW